MAVWWVILRGQWIYTVIQAVHSLLYIVAKCHFFSIVTWKYIIKYLQKCEGCTHFCEILYISSYSSYNIVVAVISVDDIIMVQFHSVLFSFFRLHSVIDVLSFQLCLMCDDVYCSGMELFEGLLLISRRDDPWESAVPEMHNNRSYHGKIKLLHVLYCEPEIVALSHIKSWTTINYFSEYHNIVCCAPIQRLLSVHSLYIIVNNALRFNP